MIGILAATNAGSWIMIVVLLVLFVGMMAISIIPQKKKQKEYQEMQNAIKVGTRIMTIGRLVGTVVAINTDNTIEVDIGAKGTPVIIVINREGIGLNLDAPQTGSNQVEKKAEGDVDAEPASENKAAEDKKEDDSI